MAKTLRKLHIRLLQKNTQPEDSVREGVRPHAWDKLKDYDARIALGTIGGHAPKWTKLLGIPEAYAESSNSSFYALVFMLIRGRWLVIPFGPGYLKLDPDAFEQDFGLRVVLNTVHPDMLRSVDVRKLDDKITSRRTQTGRRSDQAAFSIDIERDIVRGLAGEPKRDTFAKFIHGSDGLTLTKKIDAEDLPQVCSDALRAFHMKDYKKNFAWIDHINHVRNKTKIKLLDMMLVAVLSGCLTGAIPDTLHLAYPIIYDPEKAQYIRYKGFGCSNVHTDLQIGDYVADMCEKPLQAYKLDFLAAHKVHEVDDEGKDIGQHWRIKECLVFETDLDGEKYVLSADRWYRIDRHLVNEISTFFEEIDQYKLPRAQANEKEKDYNERIANGGHDMLCLDRNLVKPTGASDPIEACDILKRDGTMIHIKNQTRISSSSLSHLFNQGTVSARVMQSDGAFRDRLITKIEDQETALGVTGYKSLVAPSNMPYSESSHLIVYAVISSGDRLPFFSLVTFRQAANELRELGYKCAFAWIAKPASPISEAKRKSKSRRDRLSNSGSITKLASTTRKPRWKPRSSTDRPSRIAVKWHSKAAAPEARAREPETVVMQTIAAPEYYYTAPKAKMY